MTTEELRMPAKPANELIVSEESIPGTPCLFQGQIEYAVAKFISRDSLFVSTVMFTNMGRSRCDSTALRNFRNRIGII